MGQGQGSIIKTLNKIAPYNNPFISSRMSDIKGYFKLGFVLLDEYMTSSVLEYGFDKKKFEIYKTYGLFETLKISDDFGNSIYQDCSLTLKFKDEDDDSRVSIEEDYDADSLLSKIEYGVTTYGEGDFDIKECNCLEEDFSYVQIPFDKLEVNEWDDWNENSYYCFQELYFVFLKEKYKDYEGGDLDCIYSDYVDSGYKNFRGLYL